MHGVILPHGDTCVLRTTYRENIAYTGRLYKTREEHNLAPNVKFRDIRELNLCLGRLAESLARTCNSSYLYQVLENIFVSR